MDGTRVKLIAPMLRRAAATMFAGSVLQRRPFIIEPGGLEREGFESGLLKIGIEGGFFNFLVSRSRRNSDANFYL